MTALVDDDVDRDRDDGRVVIGSDTVAEEEMMGIIYGYHFV